MFQIEINEKITFNKHFAREYMWAYTMIVNAVSDMYWDVSSFFIQKLLLFKMYLVYSIK